MNNSRVSDIDTDLCVKNSGGNRFDLVIMASARAREIRRMYSASTKHEHMHTPITALLEFQDGKLNKDYIKRVK